MGNVDLPAVGVPSTQWTVPEVGDRYFDFIGFEVLAVAVVVDPGAGAERVFGAVFLSQLIEHQVITIVELKREPVPTGLIFCECTAAPFAIQPG